MARAARIAAIAALAPLALSACGGGGGGSSGGGTGTTASYERKFGDRFAAFFDASPNTADADVKNPTSADVPGLDLGGTPIDNN